MNARHKKALRWTLIVAVCAAWPIWYLSKLHREDVTAEMGELGMAEEFYFTFANRAGGFTHHDTQREITVVAVLPDSCAHGCPDIKKSLADAQGFVTQHLTKKHEDVPSPLPIRFVSMARFPGEEFLQGWDHVVLMPDEKPLLPPGETAPGLVVLDDASRYRAHLAFDDPEAQEKMRRLLAKITSHQFLVHYLVKQTLMWQKATGKIPPSTPIN